MSRINCGHFPLIFIPGISTIVGEEQPEEENEITYAESQQQRALERALREQKRDLEIMRAQGADESVIREQKAKVQRARDDIESFCEDTGRTRDRAREYTPVNASFEGAAPGPFPYTQ